MTVGRTRKLCVSETGQRAKSEDGKGVEKDPDLGRVGSPESSLRRGAPGGTGERDLVRGPSWNESPKTLVEQVHTPVRKSQTEGGDLTYGENTSAPPP